MVTDPQQAGYSRLYRAGSQQSPFTQTPAANYAALGALGSPQSPQMAQAPRAHIANPADYFQSLTQGVPASSQGLMGLEPQLQQAGYQVMRNARGQAGKVRTPGGQAVDVLYAGGTNDPNQMHWQWLVDQGAGQSGHPLNGLFRALQLKRATQPAPELMATQHLEQSLTPPQSPYGDQLRQHVMNQLAMSQTMGI